MKFTYCKPELIELSGLEAFGDCINNGSGDGTSCDNNGNNAANVCTADGNDANPRCTGNGNTASVTCIVGAGGISS